MTKRCQKAIDARASSFAGETSLLLTPCPDKTVTFKVETTFKNKVQSLSCL